MQEFVEKTLEEAGLGDVEIHLNEWHPSATKEENGTGTACAKVVAMMCEMQNRKMAMMNFYDARIGIGVYAGLFHAVTYEPMCPWYGMKAFGNLFVMGTQTEAVWEQEDLYVLSATDGKKKGVLISNLGEDIEITTNMDSSMHVYLIDDEHLLEKTEWNAAEFCLKKNQVVYIE
jgi:hypothetical protein